MKNGKVPEMVVGMDLMKVFGLLNTTLENADSFDMEIPEVPDSDKDVSPEVMRIVKTFEAVALVRKLLASCKDKSKVSASLLFKDLGLVTADLTAKEWSPFAKLIMNVLMMKYLGDADFVKNEINRFQRQQ